MINICLVKYGTEVQGFEINQLTKDFLTPIVENVKEDYKIHIATDKQDIDLGIKDINFLKLTDDIIDAHEHWSKIFFFNPYNINAGVEDTTIIMDIDMQWQKDPSPVITYPVGTGEFVSMNRWWRDNDMPISGNFYKFKSHEFQFVYNEYMTNFNTIRPRYYKDGIVTQPNEGEQYFVYETVKRKQPWFNIKLQPAEWCMKVHTENEEKQKLYESRFKETTRKDYHDCFFDAIWTYKANK